jgi:capsular polysaccharide biosynthesis protein
MGIYIPDCGSQNIYHFLCYMIANLRFLTEIPTIIYINTQTKYVSIILKAIYPQVLLIDAKTCPSGVNTLFLAKGPSTREEAISSDAYHYIRSLLLPVLETYQPTQTYSAYVYISRNHDSSKRRLLNEKECIHPPFQPIMLQSLPILDQMYIFYKARVIVGVHGAGLVHMLFCKNSPTIIEIVSPHMAKLQHYSHIAETLGLTYQRYYADPIDSLNYESDLNIQNPSKLQALLQSIIKI